MPYLEPNSWRVSSDFSTLAFISSSCFDNQSFACSEVFNRDSRLSCTKDAARAFGT